jgi:hypothetical protein
VFKNSIGGIGRDGGRNGCLRLPDRVSINVCRVVSQLYPYRVMPRHHLGPWYCLWRRLQQVSNQKDRRRVCLSRLDLSTVSILL